jgi:phenylalanyl-tRNA synthetase alpha chain
MEGPIHPIELKVLQTLKQGIPLDFEELVSRSGLHPDQVRRSLEWLSSRGFVRVETVTSSRLFRASKDPPEEVVPEVRLIAKLKEKGGSSPVESLKTSFEEGEFSAALGRAVAAGWVALIVHPSTKIVELTKATGYEELLRLLRLIPSDGLDESSVPVDLKDKLQDLLKRRIILKKDEKKTRVVATEAGLKGQTSAQEIDYIERLTPELISTGKWKEKQLRPINVEAPVQSFYPGRRHPVSDFVNQIRETYLSMGFMEIEGKAIQSAFWNFDALFTPQDHPGRDLQDTFYIKGIRDTRLENKGPVLRVAATHESGWKTGSKGWGYKWSLEEARRLVLRTHNTVLTVQAMTQSPRNDVRVFSIGKVFRNENLDYKHLAEFHQTDGIMMGDGLTVRNLVAFLKTFYRKLGINDVRLWPSYFPYTEPSLQVVGYSEMAGDWIELGGSGPFRPEVTLPLGVTKPVLAWGLGIERLILLSLKLSDIRELYNNDIGWLRRRPDIAGSEDLLR